MTDLKYIELLSKEFPTIEATTTEIINLEAILNLPKATEHFVSDLHGEYEAFQHVLRNGSGNIKQKIDELFSDQLSEAERKTLATLIYYPEEKLVLILEGFNTEEEIAAWYKETLSLLIQLSVYSASKYTHSKVRRALPEEFAYILEELLSKDDRYLDKDDYYKEIIASIILLEQAERFIVTMCYLIQRFVVDHLHVAGDIYDRGPHPEKIMDALIEHHSVDIQWGNHDIIWMGAACGSEVCMANVIRISARYDNLEIVEDAYGISLRHLVSFAESTYSRLEGDAFYPVMDASKNAYFDDEIHQLTKIQQAMAVIQFKLEGQVINRHPEFKMDHRLMLEKMDSSYETITLNGKTYPLKDAHFPTVDPADPYRLTPEEEAVVSRLSESFRNSERLQEHVRFLVDKGSMYLTYNDNLIFHGCIPLNPDGSFMNFEIDRQLYHGKALFDQFDRIVREGYYLHKKNQPNQTHMDLVWYLWSGAVSPLFGKSDMTTFERYYIEDKHTHKEHKNAYFRLRDNEDVCLRILSEFGVSRYKSHIINGHTPVIERKGEDPVKANGRLIVIDGGYSKPYQKQTGLGGYTLLYNSYGMQLAAHQPFSSKEDAIQNETDIVSTRRIVDKVLRRRKVKETDIGVDLMEQITDLHKLLQAYKSGKVVEKKRLL